MLNLKQYLRCFASEQLKLRVHWLRWAEFWYNTTFQGAIKLTPFQAVYGKPPPTILQHLPGETRVEEVSHALLDRDEIIRQLKYNLHKA